MDGVYNYIPETNHVYGLHGVAAVLYLQSVLHVAFLSSVKCVLYFYISTFRSLSAVRNMAGFVSIIFVIFNIIIVFIIIFIIVVLLLLYLLLSYLLLLYILLVSLL